MMYQDITGAIGNTPTVELTRMTPNPRVRIYAKLEGFNPTGSLKDRIVKFMVEQAEASGELTKDRILLEPTSGNTGIALGMFARLRGYRLTVVMPDSMSVERRELLRAFGAEVVLSEGGQGTNGAIRKAQAMLKDNPRYLMLDQYSNPANPRAHYETTAAELLQDITEPIDVFVAGLGTGGTLMGVGRRLKERYPRLRIVAVQPYPKGGLQGLRNVTEGFIPPLLDLTRLDANELVKDEDAFIAVKALADREALLAGISSGAVVHQAVQEAKRMTAGVIVTILPDGGWKYLSERLWSEEIRSLTQRYQGTMW